MPVNHDNDRRTAECQTLVDKLCGLPDDAFDHISGVIEGAALAYGLLTDRAVS